MRVKQGWYTKLYIKTDQGGNMKKEKVKYIITKTPAQINKVIDKLKDTPEWKRTAKRFSRKAMEVISKL